MAVSLRPLPLVHDLPPYIIPSDQLSLADLEANIFTVVGNLPRECQKLYANVAGAHIVLIAVLLMRKRKIGPAVWAVAAIACAQRVMHLTCPGNGAVSGVINGHRALGEAPRKVHMMSKSWDHRTGQILR